MSTNSTPHLPSNATLTQRKDGAYALRCPYEESLPAALKRLGGLWDSAQRVWVIPAGSLDKLDAMFARRSAKANKPDAVAARAADALARDHANAVKWLGYVEDSAAEGRIYQAGVDKLRGELQIARWPELVARLDAAIATARANRAALEAKWAQEKAQRQNETYRTHAHNVAHRDLVHVMSIPAFNQPMHRWAGGPVVVYTGAGKAFRLSEEDADSWATHLLGHEGERVCYVYFREATAAEIADLELLEAGEHALREMAEQVQAALRQAEQTIIALNDRPEQPQVEGDEHHNTRTLYGGGSRFVVGRDWVWFIRGNGADGDNFSLNNLPGEIAWRAPYSDDLAALVQ